MLDHNDRELEERIKLGMQRSWSSRSGLAIGKVNVGNLMNR